MIYSSSGRKPRGLRCKRTVVVDIEFRLNFPDLLIAREQDAKEWVDWIAAIFSYPQKSSKRLPYCVERSHVTYSSLIPEAFAFHYESL
jgi:hypothetical protein